MFIEEPKNSLEALKMLKYRSANRLKNQRAQLRYKYEQDAMDGAHRFQYCQSLAAKKYFKNITKALLLNRGKEENENELSIKVVKDQEKSKSIDFQVNVANKKKTKTLIEKLIAKAKRQQLIDNVL